MVANVTGTVVGNESRGIAKIYHMIATLTVSYYSGVLIDSKDVPITEVTELPFVEFALRNFSSPPKERDGYRD